MVLVALLGLGLRLLLAFMLLVCWTTWLAGLRRGILVLGSSLYRLGVGRR